MRWKNETRHNEMGSEATRCIHLRQNNVSCGNLWKRQWILGSRDWE